MNCTRWNPHVCRLTFDKSQLRKITSENCDSRIAQAPKLHPSNTQDCTDKCCTLTARKSLFLHKRFSASSFWKQLATACGSVFKFFASRGSVIFMVSICFFPPEVLDEVCEFGKREAPPPIELQWSRQSAWRSKPPWCQNGAAG